MTKIAVLLLGFGGPDCMDDVAPFVSNVAGREMPAERLAGSIEKYRVIGGKSPLRETSQAQADLLQERLRKQIPDLRVYLGMRYWHPLTSETIDNILNEDPECIVLMSLSPYFSDITTGEYIRVAVREIKERRPETPVLKIEAWNEEPDLIEGFARMLEKAMEDAPSGTPVVFTAHSLPQTAIDNGDPYEDQVRSTASKAADVAGLKDWTLGWQSEGHGRGRWLQPNTDEVLENIKADGGRGALMMPIGFTADHMETLYDIDVVMRDKARQIGLEFYRADCLNADDDVAKAMAGAVLRILGDERMMSQ